MEPLLRTIRLINFRNHTEYTADFSQTTIITGGNGTGKTSIIEAISYLSVASSWKTDRDTDVIQWGEGFTRIIGQAKTEHELALQRSPAYKRLRIDGVSKRLKDVLGVLPSVLFQPDDSMILYGAPSYRRQLLDRLLSQTEQGYAQALLHYQKVLKQRNKLLKRIQEGLAARAELEYWDVELGESATIISESRKKFMDYLEGALSLRYTALMPNGESLGVFYNSSPEGGTLKEKLAASRDKEIAAGSTLYGPHREDIIFTYGSVPAQTVMSRGQGRALIIALKILEIQYIEAATDNKAILLLDDIFSELDESRQVQLIDLLPGNQTVLSTTHIDVLRKMIPGGYSEIKL